METPQLGGMTRRDMIIRSAIAAAGLSFAKLARAAATEKKKVLFFTKSSDFEHDVIKRKDGEPSYAERYFTQVGPAQGIEFTYSKDGSLFTPEYLAQFDAFCFYTSGDLMVSKKAQGNGHGGDGNPPMTAAGKAAFLDAIAGGKGFIGIHSAADTFHTGETGETNTGQVRSWRYRNLGDKADPYTRMLGAEFIVHGMQQKATIKVVDPRFPGFENVGDSFVRKDEWYSLIDFSHDLHVLLIQETSTMGGPEVRAISPTADGWKPYLRPPYPCTWARMHGKGRVFYTSMGHGDNGPDAGYDWDMPIFHDILRGGMAWAVGHVDADITPNIDQVTPEAWTFPPMSGPVAGLPKAPKKAKKAPETP